MNRLAADYLDEITAVAEQWIRRCNGQPAEGKPVGRRNLRMALAISSDVSANGNGIISWTASGKRFTAAPVRT